MSNLRVSDINDALREGKAAFRTLKDITIEFDDNRSSIYACEKEYCLVQAYLKDKPVILKVNFNSSLDETKIRSDLYMETAHFKEELKVINTKNNEIFTDITMVNDESGELLSFIAPDTENGNIISAFVKFLITLYSEKIIINNLSLDNCYYTGDKILLSPVGKCETVYIGDTEAELTAAFKNYTLNMLAELLLEIFGIKNADSGKRFKIGKKDFTEENIQLLRENKNRFFPVIEKLLRTDDRSEIVAGLNFLLNLAEGTAAETAYEIRSGYSEDRVAAVDKKSGKWGYLNLKGEVAIPFIYEAAASFYENIAVVKKDGLYGSIDRDGQSILGFSYKELSWEGRYNIYIFKKDSLYGLIDRNGKIVLEECFLKIGRFNDGCAVVQSPENHLFGAVNSSGDVIIEPIYDKMEPFSEMRTAAIKDGKAVVFDIFGDKI